MVRGGRNAFSQSERDFDFLLELECARVILVEGERLLTRVERRLELPLGHQLTCLRQGGFHLRRSPARQCFAIGAPRIWRRCELRDADAIARPSFMPPGGVMSRPIGIVWPLLSSRLSCRLTREMAERMASVSAKRSAMFFCNAWSTIAATSGVTSATSPSNGLGCTVRMRCVIAGIVSPGNGSVYESSS
jgi:hypothetical protein